MFKEDLKRRKKQVGYVFDEAIGKFSYGKNHPMQPKRVLMTHQLINSLQIYRYLDVYRPPLATVESMIRFHDREYIQYLSNHVSPSLFQFMNPKSIIVQQLNNDADEEQQVIIQNQGGLGKIYKIGETSDCPQFDGLFNFCQLSVGGSELAAHIINNELAEIAINWAGGLHHAQSKEASGFCYVNDIVICIIQLLQCYNRVVYIDIDVHHGDGVQEAFFTTNRVMTVSFHQYTEGFFPGSGGLETIGQFEGKYYSVNVPLQQGMNDQMFESLFQNIMERVMDSYRPNVVVLQSGADSLANDLLGRFNLSTQGHASCLQFMQKFGLPIVLLGGGGYRIQNVARCWAYETALCVGKVFETNFTVPQSDYFYDSYSPDFQLHIFPKFFENMNQKEDINQIQRRVLENLRQLQCAPSVQFHDVPDTFCYNEIDEDEMEIEGQGDSGNISHYNGSIKNCLIQNTDKQIPNVQQLVPKYFENSGGGCC